MKASPVPRWFNQHTITTSHGLEENVRNLGNLMVNLIQKYNISRFVTAYMCMCISLMNATACIHDVQMDTVKA